VSSGSDVLYPSYATVTGTELLFYDGSAKCGSDNRLLQTDAILGNKSLRAYLTGLPAAADNACSAQNHTTPIFRNTGCTQPFNPTSAPNGPCTKFGVNVFSGDVTSEMTRFSWTYISWDAGIGSKGAADGSYRSGDLDVAGDGVNGWSGHVVTVFVR
jgi:hypothetical protein